MKRFLCLLAVVLLLSGCAGEDSMDRAIAARQKLLDANGCEFQATVTADYGEKLHTFVLECACDASGKLTFDVVAPDTISGITGTVTKDVGHLTFDGQALAFDDLADGQIAPVTAPWLLIRTLHSGYIAACSETDNGLHLTVDDSYADDAVQLEIWLDADGKPTGAEVIWQGRRILTIKVDNFEYL